jgi:hypothetical protein
MWVLAACGGGEPTTCSPAGTFSAPFTTGIKSSSGNLMLAISSSPTSPPQRGNGSLHYLITDASGNPVDGLTLTVVPWMVQMGHGSSINPCVLAKGHGVYEVNNVYLFMAGEWQLKTTVSGGATDSFAPTVQVN